MRIGIDCDGVLRDFIPALIDSIKETHPEHTDKILAEKLGFTQTQIDNLRDEKVI